ncbi:ankyrin repeat domain-containing protein [Candidatus Peregrinibacteria bacterium]|nr:ankyrin repeat domain-containing protein [Candidatus Peregrinibacteria bacterium]
MKTNTLSQTATPNHDSETRLIEAIKGNNLDEAKRLIEAGTPLNSQAVKSATPLACASIAGNYDIVRLLIERGTDVNEKNAIGFTVLYLLIGWMEAEINKGRPFADFAIDRGHADIVRLLIKSGADVNEKDEEDGAILLHMAVSADTARLLIECGADMHATNNEGLTPLDLALKKGHTPLADLLRKTMDQ